MSFILEEQQMVGEEIWRFSINSCNWFSLWFIYSTQEVSNDQHHLVQTLTDNDSEGWVWLCFKHSWNFLLFIACCTSYYQQSTLHQNTQPSCKILFEIFKFSKLFFVVSGMFISCSFIGIFLASCYVSNVNQNLLQDLESTKYSFCSEQVTL